MTPEQVKERLKELPDDHDEALAYIKKVCELPDGFQEGDIHTNHQYWDLMNLFRLKFANFVPSPKVVEEIKEESKEDKSGEFKKAPLDPKIAAFLASHKSEETKH